MGNNTNILSYKQYEQAYLRRNPDKAPLYQKPDVNIWSYLALLAILTGVNFMSAAHTIPVLQKFFIVPPFVSAMVGVAGFLGIEGAILYLMARGQRGIWEYLVIILATIAAIVSNLYGTFEAIDINIVARGVSTVSNEAIGFIGMVIGLFVPLVNIAAGEVFHKLNIERSLQVEQANKEYAIQLSELRSRVEGQYKRYLRKQGITDLATQEAYLRGDEDEIISQVIADNPNTDITTPTSPSLNNPKTKAEEIAVTIIEERQKGNDLFENNNYDTLAELFGTSKSTISKAKKIVEGQN